MKLWYTTSHFNILILKFKSTCLAVSLLVKESYVESLAFNVTNALKYNFE